MLVLEGIPLDAASTCGYRQQYRHLKVANNQGRVHHTVLQASNQRTLVTKIACWHGLRLRRATRQHKRKHKSCTGYFRLSSAIRSPLRRTSRGPLMLFGACRCSLSASTIPPHHNVATRVGIINFCSSGLVMPMWGHDDSTNQHVSHCVVFVPT